MAISAAQIKTLGVIVALVVVIASSVGTWATVTNEVVHNRSRLEKCEMRIEKNHESISSMQSDVRVIRMVVERIEKNGKDRRTP